MVNRNNTGTDRRYNRLAEFLKAKYFCLSYHNTTMWIMK